MGSSKSFWSYLKTAITVVLAIIVGILVIYAFIVSEARAFKTYFVSIGILFGLGWLISFIIGRTRRKNK